MKEDKWVSVILSRWAKSKDPIKYNPIADLKAAKKILEKQKS